MVVVVVMTVMVVMTVVVVMAVMAVVTAVMAAAVHHMPTATTVAAAMTAAVAAALTAGFSTSDGQRRQADNDRCGKGEDCSALEHVCGSLVCSAGAHPRSRASVSLWTRRAAVLAITLLANLVRRPRGARQAASAAAQNGAAFSVWIAP
jgi:uncharacterized protein with FMN-binding domain